MCSLFDDLQSGLHPNQVDYVNAHATSTPLGKSFRPVQLMHMWSILLKISYSGDAIEANAIKTIFSEHATSGSLALSSTKVNLGTSNQIDTFRRIITIFFQHSLCHIHL